MNKITPKIAAGYARQSTIYQTKSIPEQIAGMKKAAEKRGMVLLDDLIFTDELSGTTDERPGFDALKKAAHDGTLRARGVNTLLFWATDRVARNLKDALNFEDEMSKEGITCESVTEAFDVNTLGGKTAFTLRALLAEHQNKRRAVDIRRGQRSAVAAGKYIFEPPYGYAKNAEKGLCIVIPEAQVIRRMIHALLAGKSPRQITRMLNEAKVPSPRGKRWQHAHVCRMLRNEIYAGIIVHGFGKGSKNIKRDTAIVEPFHHPAVLDWDMFIAAQKVLDQRSKLRRFTRSIEHFYLLAGMKLLKCGVCGMSMFGKRYFPDGREYLYYRCGSRSSTGQNCGLAALQCRVLDEVVLAQLEAYASDRKKIDTAWARHHEAIAPQVEPAQQEIATIDQKIAGLRQREERLVEAFAEAQVALPVLQGHVKKIKDEVEGLEARRQALKEEIERISKTMADGGVLNQLADFRKTFDRLNPEGKKLLVRTFIDSITVRAPDQFEIALRFLPETLIVKTTAKAEETEK